jgi:hypothetical protein
MPSRSPFPLRSPTRPGALRGPSDAYDLWQRTPGGLSQLTIPCFAALVPKHRSAPDLGLIVVTTTACPRHRFGG